MPIDLQQVINSRLGVSLVSVLGRLIPPKMGYHLCNLIADWLATQHHSGVIQAIRANQWVIRGANLDKEALDTAVREVLRNNARSLYDLYHYMENPKAMQRMIRLNAATRALIERPQFGERGLVIVGLHLSSFDLMLQWLVRQGIKVMVLTLPDPRGGREIEYATRKKMGMHLVPTSVSALRQAVRYLQQGGIVLTGADRPIPDARVCPKFFSRPAPLPVHHAYLASRARVPVMIMAALQQADGKYHSLNSELIELEESSDPTKGSIRNAETVLQKAEEFIRLDPDQWSMHLPVWPELLGKIPG
jgi:lauroyl/myristoyl acyltransferase